MSKSNSVSDDSINLEILGQRTLDYVTEILSLALSGFKRINLVAYGGNIRKGIEVAQIMSHEFQFSVDQIHFGNQNFFSSYSLPLLRIPLRPGPIGGHAKKQKKAPAKARVKKQSKVVSFPEYFLYLDHLLNSEEELHITHFGSAAKDNSLTIYKDVKGIYFKPNPRADKKFIGLVANALVRAGVVTPRNWFQVSDKISQFDDVVICADTNVFYNAAITANLLRSFSLVQPIPYKDTPNWVLLVVSANLLFELERNANIRIRKDPGDPDAADTATTGHLKSESRNSYRALQEILELQHQSDITGLSLVVSGEAEFHEQSPSSGRNTFSDSIIRKQFRQFLKGLNMNHNAFFLTGDKTSHSIALTEGLRSIYLEYDFNLPDGFGVESLSDYLAAHPKMGKAPYRTWFSPTNIGSVMYELAVSLGEMEIAIGRSGKKLILGCDKRGSSFQFWVKRKLFALKESGSLIDDFSQKHQLDAPYETLEKLANRFFMSADII